MRSSLTIAMVLGLCGVAVAGSTPLPAFVEDTKVQRVESAKLDAALAAAEAGNPVPLRAVMADPFMKAVDSREDQGDANFVHYHPDFGSKFVLAEQLLAPPAPPPVMMPPIPPPVVPPTPPVMSCPPAPTCPSSPPVVIPPVVTPPSPGGSPPPGGGPPPTSPGPEGGAVPEPSSFLMLGTGLLGLIGWRRWLVR